VRCRTRKDERLATAFEDNEPYELEPNTLDPRDICRELHEQIHRRSASSSVTVRWLRQRRIMRDEAVDGRAATAVITFAALEDPEL